MFIFIACATAGAPSADTTAKPEQISKFNKKTKRSAGSDVSHLCIACQKSLTHIIYHQDGSASGGATGEGGDMRSVGNDGKVHGDGRLLVLVFLQFAHQLLFSPSFGNYC